MKTIYFIVAIFALVSTQLAAQEIFKFTGVYMVQEVCTSGTIEDYTDTTDYDIEIEPSSVNSIDIQFYLPIHLQDTIRAKVLDENNFEIPLQNFLNYDSTNIFFSGTGKIFQDSIEIQYSSGSSAGEFNCICKGVKKKAMGLNNIVEDISIQVFPNPVERNLILDLDIINDNQDITILIYNINGFLILKRDYLSTKIINVSELVPGTYFYRVNIGNNKYSGRFIKE